MWGREEDVANISSVEANNNAVPVAVASIAHLRATSISRIGGRSLTQGTKRVGFGMAFATWWGASRRFFPRHTGCQECKGLDTHAREGQGGGGSTGTGTKTGTEGGRRNVATTCDDVHVCMTGRHLDRAGRRSLRECIRTVRLAKVVGIDFDEWTLRLLKGLAAYLD